MAEDQKDETLFNDVMLDIETLGTQPGCAVVSIGAVLFNRPNSYVGPTFSANISIVDLIDNFGFSVSGGTIQWWLNQSSEAQAGLLEGSVNVVHALMDFARFVTDDHDGGCDERVRVWGNGAGFDNVLVRQMYERMRLQAPWKFWNDRCYRTLKNENDKAKELLPTAAESNVAHRALDDALWQTYHLLNMDAGYVKFDNIGVDGTAQMELELKGG